MPTSVRPSATSLLLLTLGHGGESGIFHWALGCSGPGRRTYTTTLAFLCHTFVCPGSSAGPSRGLGSGDCGGWSLLSRGRHSVTRCCNAVSRDTPGGRVLLLTPPRSHCGPGPARRGGRARAAAPCRAPARMQRPADCVHA